MWFLPFANNAPKNQIVSDIFMRMDLCFIKSYRLVATVLFVVSYGNLFSQCNNPADYTALRALYLNTSGDNWINNSGWPDATTFMSNPSPPGGTDMSNWFGIQCNINGRVVCVDLDGGFSCDNSTVNGSGNNLSGSLPAQLGGLSELVSLYLSHNQITGSIPASIANLPQIVRIWLNDNDLSGTIPVFNTPSLEWLHLSDNGLAGGLPGSYTGMPNVVGLYCSNNALTGSIPTTINQALDLEYLDFDGNSIMGLIPNEIGDLSSLQRLNASYNNLSGPIPSELGGIGSLQRIFLSGNQLTGSIPLEIGNIVNLQSLWLDNNLLSGCLDPNLANLCSAPDVNISNNPLLDNDNWASFCSNQVGLCGACTPANQNDFDALMALYNSTGGPSWTNNTGWVDGAAGTDCDYCNWYGVTCNLNDRVTCLDLDGIPDCVWIDGGSNNLTGTLPPELGDLSELDYLSLAGTFTGSIPNEVYSLSNLQHLILKGNVSGQISSQIGLLSNLIAIHIPDNQLSGSIPPGLATLSNLRRVNLSDNNLTGVIPVNMGSNGLLTHLLLRDNLLTGPLPASIGLSSGLNFVDLQSNLLSSDIPPEFGNLTALTELWLNDNDLDGCLPSELQNLCSVPAVDISNNPLLDNDDWASFCASQAGMCITCPTEYTITYPTVVCEGENFVVQVDLLGGSGPYDIDIVEGANVLASDVGLTGSSFVINVPASLMAGAYTLDATITENGSPCPSVTRSSSSSNSLTIQSGGFGASLSGFATEQCFEDDIIIDFDVLPSPSSNPPYNYSFSYSIDGGGAIMEGGSSSTEIFSHTLMPSVSGTYDFSAFVVTDADGCDYNSPLPLFSLDVLDQGIYFMASTPSVICDNDDYEVLVEVVGGDPPYDVQLREDGVVIGGQQVNMPFGVATFMLSGRPSGTYTYTVDLVDNSNCDFAGTGTPLLVTISDSPTPVIDGPTQVCLDETITLSLANSTGINNYFWEPSGNADQPEQVVGDGTGPQTYELWVTDINGCLGSASTTVDHLQSVEIDDCTEGQIFWFVSQGPYDVSWSGASAGSASTGDVTYDLSSLGEGSYFVTVTDADNCSDECTFTILPSNCNHPDLADLRSLYTSTGGGTTWSFTDGWDDPDACDPCDYNGSPWYGIICDQANQRVEEVNLRGNGLTGEVRLLSSLDSLRRIDFANNDLRGGDWAFDNPQLVEISISDNPRLATSMPSFSLPNLELLYCSGDSIRGPLPDFAGTPNLRELFVYDNPIGGVVNLAPLDSLRKLSLYNCGFTGSVPSLPSSTLIEDFFGDANSFTGEIPLLSTASLDTIYLADNNLSGCYPSDVYCSGVAYNFFNNPLLPYSGDYSLFCATMDQDSVACGVVGDSLIVNCLCQSSMVDCSTASAPQYVNPPFDVTVSCDAFPSVLDLSYTNNEVAPCVVEGVVQGMIVDSAGSPACGSFYDILYNTSLPDGSILSYQYRIDVTPAPRVITLSVPDNFTTMPASQVGLLADATYTNGLNGLCAIDGSVTGTLTPDTYIEGDTVMYDYAINFGCGDTLIERRYIIAAACTGISCTTADIVKVIGLAPTLTLEEVIAQPLGSCNYSFDAVNVLDEITFTCDQVCQSVPVTVYNLDDGSSCEVEVMVRAGFGECASQVSTAPVQLTLSDVSNPQVGDQITVDISVAGFEQISALSMDLSYADDALVWTGYIDNSDFFNDLIDFTNPTIRIRTQAGPLATIADGTTVVSLQFEVVEPLVCEQQIVWLGSSSLQGATGCESQQVRDLTVVESRAIFDPIVPIISGQEYCAGERFSIAVDNAIDYEQIIFPYVIDTALGESTILTLLVVDNNFCSQNVDVEVEIIDPQDEILPAITICPDSLATVIVDAWQGQALAEGINTVTVSDVNGCSYEQSITVVFDSSLCGAVPCNLVYTTPPTTGDLPCATWLASDYALSYDYDPTGCDDPGTVTPVIGWDTSTGDSVALLTWTMPDGTALMQQLQPIAGLNNITWVDPPQGATISCEEAVDIEVTDLGYTNGLLGDCERSGLVSPQMVVDTTACGGEIAVSYQAVVGSTTLNHVTTYTVLPAAAPDWVDFPEPYIEIACESIQGELYALNYTNDAEGACQVAGQVSPTVINPDYQCGDTVLVTYTYTDPCGRDLTYDRWLITERCSTPTLANDSLTIDVGTDYELDLLDNDNLTSLSASILAVNGEVESIAIDSVGNLFFLVSTPFVDPIVVEVEICIDGCFDCGVQLVTLYNAALDDIVQTTFIQRSSGSLDRLAFNNQDVLDDAEVWIYNRWGQEIYYSDNYGNDWAAEGYPAGIYFYVIKRGELVIKQTLTVFD